jgi:AcrR family transcriptional regulator
MPHRSGLTERAVAERALDILDAEGLEGLSVRALARSLGVAPMSIYTYFADRDAILDGVAQLLYAQVEAPTDPRLGPADTVRAIMRSVRQVLHCHPHAVPLVATYPPRTLDALAFVESGYRSFINAGVDPETTARAYRALVAYSIGTAEVEINRYFDDHPAAQPAGSLDAPTLERHTPNISLVGPHLSALDDAEEFEYGLSLLIDGLVPSSA